MTIQEWLGVNNTLGIDIWEKKYRNGNETFDEWLDRVSGGKADVRKLIVEKKFLPGGRVLANRGVVDEDGKKRKLTYSNCYVIAPPEDNIESIFECATKLARTYSYGGGCGVDLSKLSPRGAKINNAAKSTTGAVSFMELYNLTTSLIGQSGRRGALMLSLSCDHPDLEEFIEIKSDLDKINKANLSIRVTDGFMQAVKDDSMHTLSFLREETGEVIEKEVRAKDVFRKLCELNWRVAEPGILYWDRINNWNLLSEDPNFEYAGVNPCAEEPLPAGGSCCLGSLNLSAFVSEDGEFCYSDFTKAVGIAVKAMNHILDEGLALHPLKEQYTSVGNWRQIGVGIMGLADMLIKMGIRYGSEEAVDICDNIGSIMANSALHASAELAAIDGAYPMFSYDYISKSNFYSHNACSSNTRIAVEAYGLRNSQLLTIAPTGTLSTMLGISGGIEPIFANYYERKTESLHGEDVYYKVYTPIVQKYMEEHNIIDYSYVKDHPDALEKYGISNWQDIKNEKDLKDFIAIAGLVDINKVGLPEYFITARDLDYRERIAMQAVWQDHIDASISSTVNVPNEFTIDDVYDLYMHAWEKGLKGVTIFRDGCERAAVLNTASSKDKKNESTDGVEAVTEAPTSSRGHSEGMDICVTDATCHEPNVLARGEIIKASDKFVGKKRTLRTGCGTLHCEAFFDPDNGELREVYLSKGSTGGCGQFMVGLSRMVSLAARGGIDIEDIVDQLKSSGTCPSYAVRRAKFGDTSVGSSCPVAVGNALIAMHEEMIQQINFNNAIAEISKKDETVVREIVKDLKTSGPKCPECDGDLVFEGGCCTCKQCGYSKCD